MGALIVGWRHRLGWAAGWLGWEIRRAGRRFLRRQEWLGLGVVLCGLTLVVAWSVERFQAAAARTERTRWIERADTSASTPDADLPSGRSRMQRFELQLLAHDELPSLVQDLLNLAEDMNVSAARGEYRPQVDARGGFLRYRISLRASGKAQEVHRFIETALRGHRALGLESVQFQRQRIDSEELEARIQWVVLARLPDSSELGQSSGDVR